MTVDAVRDRQSLDLTQVKRAAEHDLGWDRVLLQHQLAAIDVVQEQVEGAQALLQPGFQSPPRAGVDDPRDDVRWKHLLGALGVRGDGEGDAVVAEHFHRQGRPAPQLVRTEAVQLLVESTVGGSRPAGGRKHLVIEAVELVVGIKIHETHRYSVCAIPQPERTINLRVGCEFRYDVSAPTVATVQVRPRSDASHQLVTETWSTQPPVPVDEYADFYGNPVKRLLMPEGELALRYDAVVAVPDEPDAEATAAPQLPVHEVPGELLHFTLPSRYCLSDRLMGMAWALFGQPEPSGARVQAVCDWVHDNIKFQYGASNPLTTAVDVLEQGRGVCRDLAHLAITFCRAMNIP